MANKYNSIKRLISLWESYEEESDQPDFSEFATWLTTRLKEIPEPKIKPSKMRVTHDEAENEIFKFMDEPMRFLEYVARISKLHEFYIKKFFYDLPVKNRLEYLFLFTVSEKKVAKKTALINTHLVDYTTGMDTIKRLVKNGWLEELPDDSDKRAKLLVLTNEGKHILKLSGKKLSEEIQMFLACVSMNKWKKTMTFFEEVNEFHTEIYQIHSDKTPLELMNLMDSLKHLYR